MNTKVRYLAPQIQHDLPRKMVFVGGPRQVGKTTLAKSFLNDDVGYMNWDVAEQREMILRRQFASTSLWVFDEIHKYRLWRNYLKGIFDSKPAQQQILVTGSARLDYYRFSGDSLQGRYHYLRLHPLSLAELGTASADTLLDLLFYGGFPEPFFGGSAVDAKRWSRDYRYRLIREDLVALERVHDLGTLETLALRLPQLVGAPLSINALREDLQYSHKAVANWLEILERLYAIFRIAPFGPPKIRAVKKEQKHYHFDWQVVPELPQRFENLVASALLKWTHFLEDSQGEDLSLRYFRDVHGREVDFIILHHDHPILMVECKWNDDDVSPALIYLKNRYPDCDAWQISAMGKKDYITPTGIRVAPARLLLKDLV